MTVVWHIEGNRSELFPFIWSGNFPFFVLTCALSCCTPVHAHHVETWLQVASTPSSNDHPVVSFDCFGIRASCPRHPPCRIGESRHPWSTPLGELEPVGVLSWPRTSGKFGAVCNGDPIHTCGLGVNSVQHIRPISAWELVGSCDAVAEHRWP